MNRRRLGADLDLSASCAPRRRVHVGDTRKPDGGPSGRESPAAFATEISDSFCSRCGWSKRKRSIGSLRDAFQGVRPARPYSDSMPNKVDDPMPTNSESAGHGGPFQRLVLNTIMYFIVLKNKGEKLMFFSLGRFRFRSGHDRPLVSPTDAGRGHGKEAHGE